MADPVLDRAQFWSPPPDWRSARILAPEFYVARVDGLGQTLVSGDVAAATASLAPNAAEAGFWTIVDANTIVVRVARDRALIVTQSALGITPGWRAEGFAVSPADDAYAVFEIAGTGLRALVAEGTSASLTEGSRSASVLFAGVNVLLYRTGPDRARLHVEAPFATYLWTWIERRVG